MSDVEEMTDSESGDFSASEEEWVPEKRAKRSTTSSDDSEDNVEDSIIDKIKSKASASRAKPAAKKTPKSAGKQPTRNPAADDSDDSGSSVDDYLVDPRQLKFKKDFFAANRPPASAAPTKTKDSDSEDDDFIEPNGPIVDFQQNADFISNLAKTKDQMQKANALHMAQASAGPSTSTTSAVDIQQLLLMGESKKTGTTSTAKSTANRKAAKREAAAANSDSDWEEVANEAAAAPAMRPDDVITTIRVGPEVKAKPNRTQLELEAQLKRALNRRRKETQVWMHKVHLLAWIGHGNHVNATLNSPHLMQMCLQFIPSKSMYPKERTDQSYFEQITKWYASQMRLKGNEPHAALSRLPPLPVSLALQIRAREAISKNAYVQIFIVLLRAIGLQCRLVLNLATMPLRPPTSDLCTVRNKPDEEAKTGKSDQKANKSAEKPKLSALKTEKASKPSQNVSAKSEVSPKTSPHFAPKSGSSKSEATARSSGGKSSVKSSSSANTVKTEITARSATKSSSTSTSTSASPKPESSAKSSAKYSGRSTSNAGADKSGKTSSTRSATKPDPPPTKSPHFAASKSSDTNGNTNSSRKRSHPTTAQPQPATATTSAHFSKASTAANLPFGSPISKRTRSRPKRDAPGLPQMDGAEDSFSSSRSARKRTVSAKKAASNEVAKEQETSSESEEESDFQSSPKKKAAIRKQPAAAASKTARPKAQSAVDRVKQIDRRLLSTDDDEAAATAHSKSPGKPSSATGMNMWVEVFAEAEEQWLCIDLFKRKVQCVEQIRAAATKPMAYALAWNNDSSVRDVSARYCSNWNTTTRMLRVEPDWMDATVRRYRERPSFRTRAEDLELDKFHVKEPLPTKIGEFKNHPLYVLQRHLLKFEGIYPADAPALGFIRGETVYARACVHTLHSRDIWLKSALVVRPGESAYKVVKARPKWCRQTNRCLEPQPLEIFGHWQTQPYDPPTAENGIVPRNAYGNVELFKPQMLPKKTVHLQLPGLNRTCRKLKVDCAPAVVGFDFHSGNCHPEFDGFVVCEEFAVQVEEQYWLDQEEAQRKTDEKFEARVYGNWKRLIKGLLIRERLQKKYKFAEEKETKTKTAKGARK